jgi:GxxExxY protein
MELLCKEEVYAIMGAAMEVYNELGCGFYESIYQEALEIELAARGVPFEPQKPLSISYKGRQLQSTYIVDIDCYSQIIVELKALTHLTTREEAQILHYLKAMQRRVGLLINFGSVGKLEWKRFVR